MVILGIILALIGWIASVPILLWIGVILIIVGLVLNFVPIGGSKRRYYQLPNRTTGPGRALAKPALIARWVVAVRIWARVAMRV